MEHVERMGKGEVKSELWCSNLRERYQLKDLGAAMKVILKRILTIRTGVSELD
jgi:hypothetical protein